LLTIISVSSPISAAAKKLVRNSRANAAHATNGAIRNVKAASKKWIRVKQPSVKAKAKLMRMMLMSSLAANHATIALAGMTGMSAVIAMETALRGGITAKKVMTNQQVWTWPYCPPQSPLHLRTREMSRLRL
jgi:hypothetical protein